MKAKTLIPLIIGLGVGFFAIKMGVDMVKRAQGTQQEQYGVLVSAKSIESAARISETMLTTKQVPSSLIPGDSFTDKKKLIGRVTKVPILPGITITRAMLAPPGSEPGLGAKIPKGMRAVSVSVTEQSAVAGFISPGSRVDVSTVYSRGRTRSKLILSNVEVGAVGQSLSRIGPDGKNAQISKSVTLFLKPEQVQILNAAMGSGKGRIRLAMRGFSDDPGESLFAKLFKKAETVRHEIKLPPALKPKIMKKQPNLHLVEVRRGEEVQQLVFDEYGSVRQYGKDHPLPKNVAKATAPTQQNNHHPGMEDSK